MLQHQNTHRKEEIIIQIQSLNYSTFLFKDSDYKIQCIEELSLMLNVKLHFKQSQKKIQQHKHRRPFTFF